jgi:hypothetical protein
MKFKLIVTVLAFLLVLIACRRSAVISTDKNVYNVSIDQCKDNIDLKLSDLISECRLIPLETTDESVLNQNLRIIALANNFLVGDISGIYKFTQEGKFIRKLLNVGRGPSDIPQSYTYFVNEKNNQIILNGRYQNEELRVYDYKAEKFLDPIKKAVPGYWGEFTIYNDSLILASLNPVLADSSLYELFLQNFRGQIVSSIAKGRKMMSTRKGETVQRLQVCIGKPDTYVHYIYDDTLFKYNDNKLTPYVIVSYNTSRTFLRGTYSQEGERWLNYPSVQNSKFMLFYELTFLGTTPNQMAGVSFNYTQNYFFLKKSNSSLSRIRTYTDNITGKVQEGSGDFPIIGRSSIIPGIMQGDRLFVTYEASILKTLKPDSELLRDMPAGTTDQLQTILKNIKEMDNPVLLIGTLK